MSSSFQKTVCLQSWWLVKAEDHIHGKGIAISGFTSRDQQALRLFSSAPILKRYDVFTLETVDGICVVIQGFIDKARTEANGFRSEVIQHFLFGFPPYWEEFAKKCLGKEPGIELTAGINPGPENTSPQSERLVGMSKSSQKSLTDSDKAASEKCQNSLPYSEKATSEETRGECRMRNAQKRACSKLDRMEKNRLRRGQRKSYTGGSPQEAEVAVGCSYSNSQGLHNSSVTCSPDRCPDVPKTYIDNTSMECLAPSRLGGNASSPSTADVNVNISQCDGWIKGNYAVKSLRNRNIEAPLSPCQMSMMREPDSMLKVCDNKNNGRSISDFAKQLQSNTVLEMGSVHSRHIGLRVTTSSCKLEGVEKDDRVSTRVSEKEKAGSGSISMGVCDKGEEARASLHNVSIDKKFGDLLGAGNQRLRRKTTPRKPKGKKSTCNLDQEKSDILEGENSEKDQNYWEIRTESNRGKGVNRSARASRSFGLAENMKKTPIDSKEIKVSEKGKEVPDASPESVTYKRSRSGRLLLPPMEFWRNEMAVYDADHRITGIKGSL